MIEWIEVSDEARDESRGVNELIEQMLATTPPLHTVAPEESRRARESGEGWMGAIVRVDHAVTRTIETELGPLQVRTIVPDTVNAVYLHIHGGGWVLGGADQQDVLLDRMARSANVAVVSVEYRLAPEHPFPAGPQDCEAAALWLVENAAAEFGTDRLIIGGESAGAHLAALTLLRLRDRLGTVDPVVAANLVFGAYDMALTPSTRAWGDRNLILSGPIMAWFGDCFLPDVTGEDRRDPRISPLYADLTGLVPGLFSVGTLDPLIDDSLFMGARWRAAGNEATVLVFPESIHGFVAFPTQIGSMAIDRQIDFVRTHAAG
ncbi:MAG: alpha/beta hydrolase [Acidimicrobiales bacterium]